MSMKNVAIRVFIFLGFASMVLAQATSQIQGTVQDSTGAAIQHATVILTNLQNKTERKTVSNGSGEFTIPSVPSDLRYQVKVTMQSFKTWESKPWNTENRAS